MLEESLEDSTFLSFYDLGRNLPETRALGKLRREESKELGKPEEKITEFSLAPETWTGHNHSFGFGFLFFHQGLPDAELTNGW